MMHLESKILEWTQFFLSSSSIERPSISRIIPPIDNGAEIDMEKIESS